MNVDPAVLAFLAGAYLLGSIPTGLWLGLGLRGIDIREHGSKNIGATNTLRVLGKNLGVIALVCDVGKGLVPVLLARCATSGWMLGAPLTTWEHLPLGCGLAAILGHVFSVFLKLKGGKGMATSTGVFFGLAPVPALVAGGVFIAVVAATRMVSAGSISAAVAMSIAVFILPLPVPEFAMRVITVFVAVLGIVKHRGNIKRILRGEESKLGAGKR